MIHLRSLQARRDPLMRNNRQAGFGAVEGLVIVLVIAVIGGLGYAFVRNMNAGKSDAGSQSQTVSVPKSAAEAKSSAAQVKKELDAVNIDSSLDTSDIDAALQ